MALRIPKPPLPGRRKPPPPADPRENGEVPLKDQAAEVGAGIVGWVDERTGAAGFTKGMLFRKVPKGTNWFYTLGSATMFAFLSQAVTGVFLAMYYDPNPSKAYDSVQHITNDVWLGSLVRGMHRWGATVMIVLIFLHMGRTFFFGAYKYPRELNWVIGVVLLVLTLTMGFTGYLLPFDQRSFWATVVGVNINGTGPIIGPFLSDFLRAGPEFWGHDAVEVLCHPHAAHTGADRGADRDPPVPRRETRDDGAAVVAREAARAAREGKGLRRP